MINIIHQNGVQKISTDSYFVEAVQTEGKDKKTSTKYNIAVLLPMIGSVPIAQYDHKKDAYAIFAQMVKIETYGDLCILPLDNKKDISEFFKINCEKKEGYKLFFQKNAE